MAEQLSLQVRGMSCTGCEDRITGALKRLDGVRQSSADYRSGGVRVLFDAQRTTPAEIQARIEKAGYEVTKSSESA